MPPSASSIDSRLGNEEEATHHILDNSLPAILEKTDKKLSLQQAKMVLGGTAFLLPLAYVL